MSFANRSPLLTNLSPSRLNKKSTLPPKNPVLSLHLSQIPDAMKFHQAVNDFLKVQNSDEKSDIFLPMRVEEYPLLDYFKKNPNFFGYVGNHMDLSFEGKSFLEKLLELSISKLDEKHQENLNKKNTPQVRKRLRNFIINILIQENLEKVPALVKDFYTKNSNEYVTIFRNWVKAKCSVFNRNKIENFIKDLRALLSDLELNYFEYALKKLFEPPLDGFQIQDFLQKNGKVKIFLYDRLVNDRSLINIISQFHFFYHANLSLPKYRSLTLNIEKNNKDSFNKKLLPSPTQQKLEKQEKATPQKLGEAKVFIPILSQGMFTPHPPLPSPSMNRYVSVATPPVQVEENNDCCECLPKCLRWW